MEWTGLGALIQALGNKQGAGLTGITAAKNALRELMTKRALHARNKAGTFAARAGGVVLVATVDALLESRIDPRVASLEQEFPAFVEDYANAKRIGVTDGGGGSRPAMLAPAS